MLGGIVINQEIINYSAHIIQQRLKNFYTEYKIWMKKLSDRNAEYFRQSLVFRYHYSGDLALKRNFTKQEEKSIM